MIIPKVFELGFAAMVVSASPLTNFMPRGDIDNGVELDMLHQMQFTTVACVEYTLHKDL